SCTVQGAGCRVLVLGAWCMVHGARAPHVARSTVHSTLHPAHCTITITISDRLHHSSTSIDILCPRSRASGDLILEDRFLMTLFMKRVVACSSALLAGWLLFADLPARRVNAQRAELRSLASLFDVAAGAVRDTNGDGLADSVAARVIVPAEPTVEDVQAAA